MPRSESERRVRILGRGLRQIDHRLLYSAAWLNDPCPAPDELVRVLLAVTATEHRTASIRPMVEPAQDGDPTRF